MALDTYDADVAAGLIRMEALGRAVVAKFEEIVERFHHPAPLMPLRTLDTIHLSTAVVAGETEMVATDKRLRAAALQMGFALYPPP
jgi:predicted nucleic acid-binding protein